MPLVEQLIELAVGDLVRAKIGNPLVHHPIVMGHMLEIAAAEPPDAIPFHRAAALALLHDISAVPKITTQMVAEMRLEDPERADALELARHQHRILHMREGSAMAHRILLECNRHFGRSVFVADDIEAVCEAIRIHDNPTLDIPIPREDWFATAFREADRLWMVTPEGIQVDLVRNDRDPSDPAACLEQLHKNVARFKKERSLYPDEDTEGPFFDDETFFRTDGGGRLFNRLLGEAQELWKT